MLSDEVSQFKTIITALFFAYPYGEPSNKQVTAWLDRFKPYHLDDIRQATHAYQENETESPSIAGVMKYLKDGPRTITAADAWEWIPKNDGHSRWVTPRMLSAWGVAAEIYLQGDITGARIAFAESYNASPVDNVFQYSEGDNIPHDEKLKTKVQAYKQLKAKQWVTLEQQTIIEKKLTSQMNEAKRISSDSETRLNKHLISNQSRITKNQNEHSATGTGSNKKEVEKLRSIIHKMPCLNQNDTGKD